MMGFCIFRFVLTAKLYIIETKKIGFKKKQNNRGRDRLAIHRSYAFLPMTTELDPRCSFLAQNQTSRVRSDAC